MKKHFLTLTIGVMLTQNVLAAPTLYPMDKTRTFLNEINNPTNSDIIADSQDPYRFYVRPPNQGTAEVSGLHTVNANKGYCKEMSDLQEKSRGITNGMFDLSKDLIVSMREYDISQKEMKEKLTEISTLIKDGNLQDLELLDERIKTHEARIDAILDKIKACSRNCNEYKNTHKQLVAERKELLEERKQVARNHGKIATQYDYMKKHIEVMQNLIDFKQSKITSINNTLLTLQENFNRLYEKFGKLEGGFAALKFTSDWGRDIHLLRELNPRLSFEKIETRDVKIYSSMLGLKDISGANAIIEYMLDGQVTGENHVSLSSFQENLSGQVRLSLVGTCPMLYPNYFDGDETNDTPMGVDQMKYGLTVSYEYPTLANVNLTMKYHEREMYQKIVSSYSRKAGLFKSGKSKTKTEIDEFFSSSFDVKWRDTVGLDKEEKNTREEEMRDRVISRMAQKVMGKLRGEGVTLKLPEVPPSGALVVSRHLNETCSNSKYCKAASMSLIFLDAFFNSSYAESSYIYTRNDTVTESWSKDEILWNPWITGYNY